MIVCICKNITESKLREMLSESSLETVIKETGLCTQCCSCKETVHQNVLENAVEKLENEREIC